MLPVREGYRYVAGTKQTVRAVKAGKAVCVYLAENADRFVRDSVVSAAREAGVPVEACGSMRALGRDCGLEVGTAAAALVQK